MARQAARIPPLHYPSWRITRNWGLTADGLIEGAHVADRACGPSRAQLRSVEGQPSPRSRFVRGMPMTHLRFLAATVGLLATGCGFTSTSPGEAVVFSRFGAVD